MEQKDLVAEFLEILSDYLSQEPLIYSVFEIRRKV